MNKKILLLLLMATVAMTASAVNYEINVGGVEVSTSNYNNVTGGDIQFKSSNGYVKYNPNTNTLTLNGVKMTRTGSGNYAVHNRKCDNLTIVLMDCEFTTVGPGLKLQRNTTVQTASSDTKIISSGNSAVAIDDSRSVTFTGTCTLTLSGSTSNGCISGQASLYFKNGSCVSINNNKSGGYGCMSQNLQFEEGADVSIYTSGQAIKGCTMGVWGTNAILTPYLGYVWSQSIYDPSTGAPAKDVYVSNKYVAIINSTNFPDANFRNHLLSRWSKGYLNSNDISNVTAWDGVHVSHYSSNGYPLYESLSNRNISNLKGIEYFTNLQYLACSDNNLTSLNVQALTKLKELYCAGNQLTSLNTLPSGIQKVNASNNKFATLSITGYSSLTTLDVHDCTLLTSLYCFSNALTSLYYSGCTALQSLDCNGNQLTSLPAMPAKIKTVDCSGNKLTSITINYKQYFEKLDCSYNTMLTSLNCRDNVLTSINYSGCNALQTIDLGKNYLTSLPATPSNITTLLIDENRFATLGISGRTKLKTLNCDGCVLLTSLNCTGNALTSLSVANCPRLSFLQINNNQLKGAAMEKIVTDLFDRSGTTPGTFNVLTANYSGEGNVITTEQVKKVRNKSWMPKQYVTNGSTGNWVDIAVPGDVNGDGVVTAADITALYDVLLSNNYSHVVNGDQTGDGQITAADVTKVYTIMLGGQN